MKFVPTFPWRRDSYTADDLVNLKDFLYRSDTFRFPALPTGLFPAAHLSARGQYTRYDHVWVRDNMHVAHAHFVIGYVGVAVRTVRSVLTYFARHRHRFELIIDGSANPDMPMNRPHIRFDGSKLKEVDEDWAHAQNDALGYFLWLASRLSLAGALQLDAEDMALLRLFPAFFHAVRYWQDQDSGHWEEKRKVEASSIGVVVAALETFRKVVPMDSGDLQLDTLIANGRSALQRILPWECIDGADARKADGALLFLIYPLDVVGTEHRDQILENVETTLKGEVGIRRYLGDSFWCADYDLRVAENQRTINVSEDMSARDALVTIGQEAQWCIFDPILSVIYGQKFLAGGAQSDLSKQVHYFNRSLAQLTVRWKIWPRHIIWWLRRSIILNIGGYERLSQLKLTQREANSANWLCPELYYLRRGRYVANDVTPLLWTEANLMLALHTMLQTAAK